MYDLNEARKKIISVLGKEQKGKYFKLIRSWWLFKKPPIKIQFDAAVREILQTEEQLKAHNQFMLASMEREPFIKHSMQASNLEKIHFDNFNIADYIEPPPKKDLPSTFMDRSASSEFFLPDIALIANRIDLHAWENGLEGADKHVPELITQLCQTFMKNILTAMISRKESYKIKNSQFQYGFGLPKPNPLLRNTHNILDETQDPKITLNVDEGCFMPTSKPSVEVAEQQAAFQYACSSKSHIGEKLTVQLLYATLQDNPNIVGLHSIQSTNLLKLSLQLGEIQ